MILIEIYQIYFKNIFSIVKHMQKFGIHMLLLII